MAELKIVLKKQGSIHVMETAGKLGFTMTTNDVLILEAKDACSLWISRARANNDVRVLDEEKDTDRSNHNTKSWQRFDVGPGKPKKLYLHPGEFLLRAREHGTDRPPDGGGGDGEEGTLTVKSGQN